MTDDATDWLRFTKPTTETWKGSTEASDLDF